MIQLPTRKSLAIIIYKLKYYLKILTFKNQNHIKIIRANQSTRYTLSSLRMYAMLICHPVRLADSP